ncbi:phosphate ABC transporter permease PstA [Microbacterium sp. Kw_RZR3]|jgi:phosphate transport system permease protein|uniref:phosphate ABC transporter permease PstA n=1 Tax=unclassified Microbacterium TaxID=2609290 RepID=UPI0023DBE93D|nr:phosphate ABC transporter permease PstA [Microbacterium sp. Kw_RZR3]MDF2046488.1 phosphate ABC transporter permease PstA [Microbacterium sp. Kw_RZR3]MDF2918688.1 ABC-type phosphate transport system, permease component [Microbacterium sp.]
MAIVTPEAPTVDEGVPRQPIRTTIPLRDGHVGERRDLRTVPFGDRFDLLGSMAASLALSSLLFGWLTPMTGGIGWAVLSFIAFLGIYAVMSSLRADRLAVRERIVTALFYSAGILLLGALTFVLFFTLIRGSSALFHGNFFVETMTTAGPLDPLTVGGIAHAVVGTLIQIGIALVITIPLGVMTAVFLNEVGGPFARFVRTVSDAMTALPSIVAGLFVYAAVVTLITHERSGFAASIAISVMMLPIIIRASDVVLRLVPHNLREASYALGSSRWRTVWNVVLPTSRSGLVTAVILGTARGIGETSPVLLTSGVTAQMNLNPFSGPMISLPLQVFDFVKSPEPNMIARGFGAAATLVLLVLTLFIIARLIGGRGPGQLSDRQRRAAMAASARDLRRISADPALHSRAVRRLSAASRVPFFGGRAAPAARPRSPEENPS